MPLWLLSFLRLIQESGALLAPARAESSDLPGFVSLALSSLSALPKPITEEVHPSTAPPFSRMFLNRYSTAALLLSHSIAGTVPPKPVTEVVHHSTV